MTQHVSIATKLFLSTYFFPVGNTLSLINHHKLQESVGSIMYFFCFEVFFFFFSFINITHPTPKEKTVITIGSHTHKVFIRITVFGFTGFNMNAKNVWRPWNLNLLPAPLPAQLCSSLGRAWGGGGGGLSFFSFSYIFIYFSHRPARCNIMFIHGVA